MKNIQKSFGNVQVLNGVNLRLEKGFVYQRGVGDMAQNRNSFVDRKIESNLITKNNKK